MRLHHPHIILTPFRDLNFSETAISRRQKNPVKVKKEMVQTPNLGARTISLFRMMMNKCMPYIYQ